MKAVGDGAPGFKKNLGAVRAAYVRAASSQAEFGDVEGSVELLRKALDLDPNDAQVRAVLGFRLQELGRFGEAEEELSRAVALQPGQGMAYYGLVQSKRLTGDDLPLLERMESVLKQREISDADRSFVHYACGKASDDLARYEAAIGHFHEANRLLRTLHLRQPFDRARYSASIDWAIKTFTPSFASPKTSPSERPVFVVGMMRSGTTLVEQILSSHPGVAAGGEQKFWLQNGQRALDRFGKTVEAAGAASVIAEYKALLEGIGGGAPRVTDKMPHNLPLLGLIHALFPGARIVHCRRHPVDTCLSIYMTGFSSPPEFAHDAANIVFAYREYERLMMHWRAVLPADRFLEVDYEAVVSDGESASRRMIEFLGLEWDPACLRHEANQRSVRTPSLWQVRQPLYRSSVERWRNYEPWLGEFKELL